MIASNVTDIMKKRSFTLRSLAEFANVSYQTVQRARGPLILECRLSTLVAIASALGVRTKDLYDETPDAKKGGSVEPPVS